MNVQSRWTLAAAFLLGASAHAANAPPVDLSFGQIRCNDHPGGTTVCFYKTRVSGTHVVTASADFTRNDAGSGAGSTLSMTSGTWANGATGTFVSCTTPASPIPVNWNGSNRVRMQVSCAVPVKNYVIYEIHVEPNTPGNTSALVDWAGIDVTPATK